MAPVVAPVTPGRHVVRVAGCVALSWLGLYIHNRAELPQLTALSPENSLTAATAGVLLWAWWMFPRRRAPAIALLAWAVLHLAGGGVISVLPFAWLPYTPEQSARHYVFHVLYGGAQIPLLVAMLATLRRPSPAQAAGGREA